MLVLPRFFLVSITTLTTLLSLASATNVYARPYPDRPGVCYYFVDNELKSQSSCVIKTGYGTGIHYEIQEWSNGNHVEIYKDHSNPDAEKPDITVNDKPATRSYRTKNFLTIVEDPDNTTEKTMTCYDITGTNESICSSIKEN
jgi:hypothetical protein